MDQQKLKFITTEAFDRLTLLKEDTKPNWGVMNAREMTEHLIDFYNVSTETIKVKLFTPQEQLPKYMEFLMSEKLFKENTKAPSEMLGDVPLPLRTASLSEAKEKLKKTTETFLEYFTEDEGKKTLHPVFGMLNYDQWVRLHYKHVLHHINQFNL